ncbi:hypothetical protein Tco_1235448 [Tanacetum coccineum]
MLGCSWRGHLREVHIHYCPGVLGGDTCEGYIFNIARVFLKGTVAIGTYGFHYCSSVLRGDTYDGYIVHRFPELRNKRRMDDNILSSNNTTTNSFFKPYLITSGKNETEKEDEQSQTKRKYSNASNSIDEQPNKRMCKEEKFEAIECSLGPNEEYIAIRRCEFDIWERNEDKMSRIYQDIFQKKDNGWKVTRTK